MSGAESLVATLMLSGVDTCFANPGTSEMHFVAALDRMRGLRCILCLFEGVATGAADGYARMAGKPAATLLHCGPGLANGLANLHNAKRGNVPLLNIVGDHATYHKPLDPLLASDTEGFARAVSAWTRTSRRVENVGADAAEAVQVARIAPGHVATLILPSDVSWNEGGVVAGPLPVPPPEVVDIATIRSIHGVLDSGEPALILLAGASLRAGALIDAHRIAKSTGARLSAETFNTRIERGRGRHPIGRIPYPIDQGLAALAGIKHLILVNAIEPVAFFAYPGKPSRIHGADCTVHVLARPDQDGPDALARLAASVQALRLAAPKPQPVPAPAKGAVTPEALAQSLTALLPENAVVIDESLTLGFVLYPGTENAAPHDWLQLTGGAIGDGLPLATGAAVGAPGRRVVNLQADGSALYTVQALWTQAREKLDVTTVILSNRRYAILVDELVNVGAEGGAASRGLFSLGDPDIDWVKIAAGLGVEGGRAETMEQFADLFTAANKRRGPFLIELVIP